MIMDQVIRRLSEHGNLSADLFCFDHNNFAEIVIRISDGLLRTLDGRRTKDQLQTKSLGFAKNGKVLKQLLNKIRRT